MQQRSKDRDLPRNIVLPEHSEQDLKKAAEFRAEIHGAALARVRSHYPDADHVVDEYPADAYFQEVWDYPGKWYTVVGTPPGSGTRKDLTESIIRRTLDYYRDAGSTHSDDEFYRLIAEYPDTTCRYCLVSSGDQYAKAINVFPYRGADSHRLALEYAVRELLEDGTGHSCDIKAAKCRKLSGKALFAHAGSDNWLNYRRAFLNSPHGILYTDSDFERVNAVLFPGGAESLEAYRWTNGRTEYFEEGHKLPCLLCLTVYDKTLDRFTVITVPGSDRSFSGLEE